MASPKRISADEIKTAIQALAEQIAAKHAGNSQILLIGIANGGITLARRLGAVLGLRTGIVDISFHRDDIGSAPIPKEFHPTVIPADVTGAHIILVDDVLFSGRTVKAALNEIFDQGRPDLVELAVLALRPGRKLPIAPDYHAMEIPAAPDEKVVITLNPDDPTNDSITIRRQPSR